MHDDNWLDCCDMPGPLHADDCPVRMVNAANERTLDGVRIFHGLRVFDYNLADTRVVGVQSVSHGTTWYKTENGGMFDASRLWSYDYGVRQGWDKPVTR